MNGGHIGHSSRPIPLNRHSPDAIQIRGNLTTAPPPREKDGWHFVFLGAGIDAYETAQVIGIGPRSTASYDLGESDEAFASTAWNTVNVARSGGRRGSSDYSASQKWSMGDAYYPDGEKRKSRKRNGFSLTSR